MQTTPIEFENESIKTYLNGSLAVLEVKKDAFSLLTELPEGFRILKWIDIIKNEESIKGILMLGESNLYCEEPYKKFLSLISGEDLKDQLPHTLKHIDKDIRTKQINMLNNFTVSFLEFPKLVISYLSGCIVTPFIGLALASDIKIGTNQTSFSFLHKKYGLHPTGALPFFLYTNLGQSRAKNLMYTKSELSSEELLSLGLLDEIITNQNTNEVIEYSKNIVENNYNTIITTKKLINKTFLDHYKEFMELEQQMVLS